MMRRLLERPSEICRELNLINALGAQLLIRLILTGTVIVAPCAVERTGHQTGPSRSIHFSPKYCRPLSSKYSAQRE